MPWLETYDHNPEFYKHHPKYISNPFDKNTVGDPYTDLEKAGRSIYIEGSILPEAYHPLVAACPSVATFMEGFILKNNEDHETTDVIRNSCHTSFGFEETRTSGSGTDEAKGGKLEFGGKGSAKGGEKPQVSGSLQGGVHLSTNLKHHTNEQQGVTTISSLQESNQQSKESSTTLHSASAAILQGIVRYRNMGTAKISNVRPTLNFSVADLPLSTYKVPEVAKLSPGDSYPAFGATGVIVTPSDSFQGLPSTISTDAKNKLTAGNPLKVKTTQIQGTFTAAPGSGRYKPGTSIDWSNVTKDMMDRTARLLLETPNETLDRRVAAPSADEVVDTPDVKKPDSGIPRITVEQAIQFAFRAMQDNRGNLMVTTPQGFTYRIDRSHVTLYVDQNTDDLIAKQLKAFQDKGDETKSVYDVILTKEMVILIKPILEVHAFLSNAYLYIENQFDQSLSYSVWKNTGTSSELLKQGIVPSASTIGTGYFCENPAEKISIMVSRQVSQVIFEGKVSALTGFVNNTLQPIGEAPKMLPLNTWTTNPDPTIKRHIEYYSGSTFCEVIMINSPNKTIILPLYILLSNEGRQDYYNSKYVAISEVHYEYTIDHTEPTANKIRTDLYSHGSYTYNYLAPYSSWKGGWGMPPTFNIPIITNKEGEVSVKLKLSLYGNIHYPPSSMGAALDINGQLLYTTEIDFKMGISKQYEGKNPIPFTNPNRSFLVSFYKQSDKIYLFNKNSQSVSYCILNEYKESVWEGTLESKKLIEFTFEQSIFWKKAEYRGDQKKLSDRIIITINQIPIFDGDPKDIPSKESIQGYVSDAIKAHTLDYWHLNSTAMSPSYDSVCFKEINPKFLGALVSYEVKVAGDSIGVTPIRSLELDRKLIINFFDYTSDSNKHPKKGKQVEIIAHNVFGNTTSVFNGTAELSDALWREHYKISEWHKKGNRFDALYLAPIPTVFTENTKSYDIQIGNEITNSVLFERPDNESYIRDQRLKLDFSKKLPQDKLPKLGDSVHLFIHTIENQTVMIDLGKIAESDQPDSINALENTHDITTWTKDSDHYTSVQFNKGSENITSYVFQVNNRYYGEIPVNQVTTKLDLSKLDTDKKIRKGDYVEIYAYKKDGEGVLIQSRYAGTTGLLGAYPAKEKIQQEYHVTNWSKVTDAYTSFTLGPLSDPIDSYIKKYEGCINNSIINLTPNGLTFAFDTDKGPRHGDIVQLFAYTYSGDKIELWKLLAGAIGMVTDEEVRSIHTLKGWEDTNQTITFNTSDLKDRIQTHIQSYTIDVWNGSQKKWETFGNPIQMNAQGQLRLQDCKASQPMPQPPSFVRIQANFFDSGRKPVVVMIRIVGKVKAPPTEAEIQNAHKDLIWNFEKDEEDKLKSITFPHIDSELARYISDYQVSRWTNVIPEKSTWKVGEDGLTLTFEKPIETSIGGGKTEEQLVTDEFSAVVYWMNIEGQNLIKTLVIGEHVGEKDVKGVQPVQSISPRAIEEAHQIDSWISSYDKRMAEGFALHQMPENILAQINYYTVVLKGKEYPMPQYSYYHGKMKEIKAPADKTKSGYVFSFDTFSIPYAEHPKSGDKITIKATLVGGSTLIVINQKEIDL